MNFNNLFNSKDFKFQIVEFGGFQMQCFKAHDIVYNVRLNLNN